MPRLPRCDGPDTWHHVMNRGLARRTVFESERDVRYFISRLAYAVRAGMIEVHAYCLLTTHFHLLVRSPRGALATAIGEVQNDYVRWFNRGRQRDGSLFRGRYRSKPVEALAYREQLVRYIDFNAVHAGLVPTPSLYPHCSARWFASPRRPPWLSSWWIESVVCESAGRASYDPLLYPNCFGEPLSPGLARVVERRIEVQARGADPLDDLLDAAPERVLEWMRSKARLADGTAIDLPVCDAESVSALVAIERTARPTWKVATSRKSVDTWLLIEVVILRELCGATWREIGARVARTCEGAAQCYERHAQLLNEDPSYAGAVARIAHRSIAECHGTRRPLHGVVRQIAPLTPQLAGPAAQTRE